MVVSVSFASFREAIVKLMGICYGVLSKIGRHGGNINAAAYPFRQGVGKQEQKKDRAFQVPGLFGYSGGRFKRRGLSFATTPASAFSGLAWRRREASGTGGYAVGPHASGGDQLLHLFAVAVGTFDLDVVAASHQHLELVVAFRALILVDRHSSLLENRCLNWKMDCERAVSGKFAAGVNRKAVPFYHFINDSVNLGFSRSG